MPEYSSGFMEVSDMAIRMNGKPVKQPVQAVEVPVETVEDPVKVQVEDGGNVPVMPEGYYTWKRFPCRAYTESEEKRVKMPLVNRWQTVATNDACQLAQWVKENDCIMWGFPTGMANGFWVVDLDRGHSEGVDGVENFKRYRALRPPAQR